MNGNNQNNEEYVYKRVMLDRQHNRAWSIASLVVGIASIPCCLTLGVGIALGIMAIVFALISRRNIGYFDGLSLTGLIVGIFGIVFGVGTIIFNYVVEVDNFVEYFFIDSYQTQTPGTKV